MSLESSMTALFLCLAAACSMAPLWFRSSAGAPGHSVGASFKVGWALWILFWGTLAVLTTARLPFGIPYPLRFPALFLAPILIGALLLLVPRIKLATSKIALIDLVRFQYCRLIGGFFLVGAFFGTVPLTFALIAGIGDIIVGLAAILTTRLMKQQPARSLTLAKRHAWLGMADFVSAVGTGFATRADLAWPYSLIPLFLVPIAILAHLVTFQRRES